MPPPLLVLVVAPPVLEEDAVVDPPVLAVPVLEVVCVPVPVLFPVPVVPVLLVPLHATTLTPDMHPTIAPTISHCFFMRPSKIGRRTIGDFPRIVPSNSEGDSGPDCPGLRGDVVAPLRVI
jgi:hypothetical protein